MLRRPIPGEGQVRVGIDEPRHHAPPAGVELLDVPEAGRQAPLRPHPRDLPVLDEDGAAVDDPEIERPPPVTGHDLGSVPDEQSR